MAKKNGGRRGGRGGLFIVLLLVIAAALFLYRNNIAVVRVIQVTDVSEDAARFIAEQSGIDAGARMDSLDEAKVRAALAPFGQWEFLSLEKSGADTVILHMRARTPRAVAHYAGSTLLLDEYAQVVSNRRDEQGADGLMEIRGLEIRSAQEGSLIGTNDVNQATGVATVLQALVETDALGRVQELNAANLDNLYMITLGGVQVQMGDSENARDKCLWMIGVLDSLESEGVSGGRVDVSTGTSAVYSPE